MLAPQPHWLRAVLNTDRVWSLYALGDLTPGLFEHCVWRVQLDPAPALLLLYQQHPPPVLVAVGAPAEVAALLDREALPPQFYLSIRPEILPLIIQRRRVEHLTAMWRMCLRPENFCPPALSGVARLGPADLPALQRLYADGAATGEAPDFFHPEMVAAGVYFGVRAGAELIAAAGTHLLSLPESVGAIGNVYTRRDQRGRGLAQQVTGAVAAELVRRQIQTIGLNVKQVNAPAVRAYTRLGFESDCPFYEGLAL